MAKLVVNARSWEMASKLKLANMWHTTLENLRNSLQANLGIALSTDA